MIKKYPVLGVIMLGLGIVLTLTVVDLIRSRKWFAAAAPVDETKCNWRVTFKKAKMPPFEWPVLFNWLHNKMSFDVVNDDTITVTLDDNAKLALDDMGIGRGWKYDALRQCPPQA